MCARYHRAVAPAIAHRFAAAASWVGTRGWPKAARTEDSDCQKVYRDSEEEYASRNTYSMRPPPSDAQEPPPSMDSHIRYCLVPHFAPSDTKVVWLVMIPDRHQPVETKSTDLCLVV